MKSVFQIFFVALLLTQALAVPGAALETPCPEKSKYTMTPEPTPCFEDKYKYTESAKYTDKNKYDEATDDVDDTKYTSEQKYSNTDNNEEPMHRGARTYPEVMNRPSTNNGAFYGQGNYNEHTTPTMMNSASPSPTPSRVPDVVSGSSISLENTDAAAIGSNTLSMGAEEGSAALSGNTENGDNSIFGAVQPGGAVGFLGSFGNIFFASPSPMM